MDMAILFSVFVAGLVLGIPVAITLGLSSLGYILVAGLPPVVMPQKMYAGMDVFVLLSIPGFILAGNLMNRGGITSALINLSMALVGRLRGGLGHVNILTSVFFAGISGSAVADAAALSNTLVPEMRKRGYTLTYASAVTAASSIIGPIVPPSIILIFYGALMGTSVTALFLAGIVPGLVLAAALIVVNAVYAWRQDHPRLERAEMPALLPTIARSLPALSLPLIILGGIVFGWMTPTEAAAVAVFVALLAGWFYEGLTRGSILEALQRTAMLSGSIFIIICAVSALGHLGALERLPEAISEAVAALGLGPAGYMLVMNLIFILAGMVLDIPVALALLVPLLAPVALEQGADPVHLGIVLCFNLCIGLISPPMGGCLLVVSTVTGVNYWRLAWAVIPFVLTEIVVLAVLILVPELSLALPQAFGFAGG